MTLTTCWSYKPDDVRKHKTTATVFGLEAVANFLGTERTDPQLLVAAARTPGRYEVVNTLVQRTNGWGKAEHPCAMPLGNDEWCTRWVSTHDGDTFWALIPAPVAPKT